jgi:hypothetical protein
MQICKTQARAHLMEKDKLIGIIKSSLNKVYEEDAHLLLINIDERSINHRLALYMSPLLEGEKIHVDVEYNRHLEGMKYYVNNVYGSIDILIHERGTDKNNICAFECKKGLMSKVDLMKVQALLGEDFNYCYGVTIEYNSRTVTLFEISDNKLVAERIEL